MLIVHLILDFFQHILNTNQFFLKEQASYHHKIFYQNHQIIIIFHYTFLIIAIIE